MSKQQHIIIDLFESEPLLKEAFLSLQSVSSNLWISAGFIRNNIWNNFTKKQLDLDCDVDVIYYDQEQVDLEKEEVIQNKLQKINSEYKWSVKNQVRMAKRNNTNYLSLEDALSKFPETATCIAMRLTENGYEVLAPHGLDDLFNFVIRPTPISLNNMEIFEKRILKKTWSKRWPQVKIIK